MFPSTKGNCESPSGLQNVRETAIRHKEMTNYNENGKFQSILLLYTWSAALTTYYKPSNNRALVMKWLM